MIPTAGPIIAAVSFGDAWTRTSALDGYAPTANPALTNDAASGSP